MLRSYRSSWVSSQIRSCFQPLLILPFAQQSLFVAVLSGWLWLLSSWRSHHWAQPGSARCGRGRPEAPGHWQDHGSVTAATATPKPPNKTLLSLPSSPSLMTASVGCSVVRGCWNIIQLSPFSLYPPKEQGCGKQQERMWWLFCLHTCYRAKSFFKHVQHFQSLKLWVWSPFSSCRQCQGHCALSRVAFHA